MFSGVLIEHESSDKINLTPSWWFYSSASNKEMDPRPRLKYEAYSVFQLPHDV